MSVMTFEPPSAEALERARLLAKELCDVAAGAQVIRWSSSGPERTGELLSAADRLTMVAVRLAEIRALLSYRAVVQPIS